MSMGIGHVLITTSIPLLACRSCFFFFLSIFFFFSFFFLSACSLCMYIYILHHILNTLKD